MSPNRVRGKDSTKSAGNGEEAAAWGQESDGLGAPDSLRGAQVGRDGVSGPDSTFH